MPTEKPPVRIMACQVMQSIFESLLPESLLKQTIYLDYGLHQTPDRLTRTLQEEIDRLEKPGLVVLGYGLCGQGLDGVKAGQHTLIAPRVDDCIALFLGSRQAYLREFEAVPGTYYLCRGWLESGSHPLKEYQQYVETYGKKEALWIMDEQYQHYQRLVLIASSRDELKQCRPQALKVARYCRRWNMRYEEIVGSDRYIRRLIAQIDEPGPVDDEFILVRPGGVIRWELYYA